ncbi:MAG: flagellar protein FlgN, partial [Lachnospiraceae bacterium]|nr:flagellar protein FlgN [Lachnospiraceae bacterium]
MASLIDTLTEVLNGENKEYQKLLDLSKSKTDVIVRGDLNALSVITDKEQEVVAKIQALEHERTRTMTEIAKILNTDVSGLKLDVLIDLLKKKPKEQKALALIHDKLHVTLYEMRLLNERNDELIKSAIEMTNFNLNLLQSARKAPETANYNKGAFNTGSLIGVDSGSF